MVFYYINDGIIQNNANYGLKLTGDNKTDVFVTNGRFTNDGNITINVTNKTDIKTINDSTVKIQK